MPVIRGRSGWLVLLLWSVAASAQEPARGPWALCQADPLQGLLTPDTGADPKTSPLRFTADSGEISPLAALLSGSVVAEKGDLRLEAPMVDVDRQANLVIADDVRYGSPELAITSDHAEVDLNRERGVFDQARYYFPSLNARGQATQVEVERRGQFSRLHEANYTTCTRDSPFWQLRTGELELDRDTGRGKARDITFVIGGLPLLYLPYLSFPIDDQRQSGWLVPEAGYDSEGGFDLTLPYYWNIAPARDATLRPRLITDRGLMLGAEYRFLTPRSRGQLNAEFLPDDQVFGDNRSSFKIEHRAQPLTGLYTDLLYQEVSDDDYLDDLGDNIGLLSPDYLDRHLDLNYRTRRWQAGLRVQAFQILDRALFPPGDEPYDRLPQLTFDGSWPARFGGLNLAVRGELTRFEHDLRIDGTRADLETGFGWPLEWPAGFLRPRLQYRYTAYALDGVEADADDRPDRAAPVGSLDAGLFLERTVDWDWLGGSGLQTLEPRLFYLYVPHRAQDDIPLFDTTEIDRSYTWLFLDNRFTGADRLGDANQLTAAVTTRLLREDDGDERARLSLGQIFYFRDRRVTLDPASPPERDPNSGLIAEGRVALGGGLALRGHYQWDAERDRTQRSALHFNYEPLPNRVINLSHAFVRDTLEQLDLSFAWPVDQRWQVVGRWNYSLALDRNLDTFLGVGYEDCCWALRLLGRQYRDEPRDADARNSVYLQLELKGLSSVGRSIDRLLRDTIFGYEPVRYR